MYLITGATGLLGSHVAEQLVAQGERARALVRPTSDTRLLSHLGVELAVGDVTDPDSLDLACRDMKVLVHAAGRVGDWGPWQDFERDNVAGTANVIAACLTHGCRLIHVSSISAYGEPAPRPAGLTEATPLATHYWGWDHYRRSKVRAEELVWEAHQAWGLPVTVLRPGWMYGPRDRSRLARMVQALRQGYFPILGSGLNELNIGYAGNVAEACLLAARSAAAIGQAYHVCHDGPITQRAFLELLAKELRLPPPRWRIPYVLAFHGSFVMEAIGRVLRFSKPPPLTRYATWYLGKHIPHSTAKIACELGWTPRIGYAEGVQRTVAWFGRLSAEKPA